MWFNAALVIFLILNFLIIIGGLGRILHDQQVIAKALSELVQTESQFYGEMAKAVQDAQQKELEKGFKTIKDLKDLSALPPDEFQRTMDIIKEANAKAKKRKEAKND